MEPLVGMAFQLAEDRDVAGIADLFRQIDRVENEFRLKVAVFLYLRQEAQIHPDTEVLQRVVDETGMTGLVAGHIGKPVAYVRVLHASLDLGIEYATREFRRDGTDEEMDE